MSGDDYLDQISKELQKIKVRMEHKNNTFEENIRRIAGFRNPNYDKDIISGSLTIDKIIKDWEESNG